MTTAEVAHRLVDLCRQGKNAEAYRKLFAKNAVAVEPEHAPGPSRTEGVDALLEKGKEFQGMLKEVHSSYINEPQVAGNFFSLTMGLDATFQDGTRMNMDEVCVYEVKDGKIVKEEFFF